MRAPAAALPPRAGDHSQGLTHEEAQRRFQQDGPNELPSQGKRGVGIIAWEVMKEPMFLLLLAAGVIYLLMGEPLDASMLLGFVVIVMATTIVQQRRTERALDALRDLSSPRALVLRDGQRQRIAARELVRGDILVLAEGDRVSADALLRTGDNVSVDESLLTGESVPVRKAPSVNAVDLGEPGGDDRPGLFSGSLITAGQGLADVVATGQRTGLGRIGQALQDVQSEPTSLQREIGRLVRILALVGMSLCVVVVIAYGLTRGGTAAAWKEGLLAGIAMAMAMLPEEFPVILTIFLALGAWRISRSHVLTRRMPAIEMLGAATVLCTDKTGTLTLNHMSVTAVVVDGQRSAISTAETMPANVQQVVKIAARSCKAEPFDPMELAIHAAASGINTTEKSDWTLIREFSLSQQLLAVSRVWNQENGQPFIIASKGAPEAIVGMCRKLSPQERQTILEQASSLATEGLRVLGVAQGQVDADHLPTEHQNLDLEFLGLIALADPLRPTVPAAVAECQSAGIRVVMITGDYPATAQSIARQAGIANGNACITGPELGRMSDQELAQRIRTVAVFARVIPEQKLRIVQALKNDNQIVAMTGDGVNDAPALKAAHIGIAMGGRGTDVARESASLVLLDDDFASIVAAVKLGRRIFDNIKKAISFTLAVHVPIAGLSMLPVFMPSWQLLLLPVHIAFLELIINPACSLIFEAEVAEPDIMQRPPRLPTERLFSLMNVGLSLMQGASVLVICIGVFLLARVDHGADAARALTFTALVCAILAIIVTNRSQRRSIFQILRIPNTAQWWVIAGAAGFLALLLLLPAAQRLCHFAPLHGPDIALAVAAGLACIVWFEVVKAFRRHRR